MFVAIIFAAEEFGRDRRRGRNDQLVLGVRSGREGSEDGCGGCRRAAEDRPVLPAVERLLVAPRPRRRTAGHRQRRTRIEVQ